MRSQTMVLPDGSRIELVHLAYQDGGVGAWKIACVPNLEEKEALPTRPWPYRRSNDVRAVNCPNCMETGAYRQAKAAMDGLGAL